jgi:hypothetical protein
VPTGSRRPRVNTTPVNQVLPVAVIENGLPATVTLTELGTQPAESEYFTEKVKRVFVVPLPGVTLPWLRVMACDGLLQLAASTAGAAASMLAVIANGMTRRRRMCVPSRA